MAWSCEAVFWLAHTGCGVESRGSSDECIHQRQKKKLRSPGGERSFGGLYNKSAASPRIYFVGSY